MSHLLLLLLAASAADPRTSPVPAWPSVVQVEAPSINTASPDLVDRGGFPLLGMSVDETRREVADDRALTLDVTPLAIARALGRREPAATLLDRAAARVTLGGPLQQVPRANAARSNRATNHVTSELKLRLAGDAAAAPRSAHPALLALALGADNVGTGYGLDRYGATLIAEREGPCSLTANLGYRVVERYRVPHRIEETKLAGDVAWRAFAARREAVDVGVSGGWLLRPHADIWQSGAHVDVSLAERVRISLAARRSQRPELPGQDRTRGVLSLAWDFGRPRL